MPEVPLSLRPHPDAPRFPTAATTQPPPAAPAAGRQPQRHTRQETLTRRIRFLVIATITYNVVEAVVALFAGHRADSSALIGFGLDSIIEVSSAAAVAWQFSARDDAVRQARERRTLRIIAVSFFALALYVSVSSALALTTGVEAAPSTVGIVLAALSLLIMPFLSTVQRRAGRELGSATAVADSQQTMLCTYLSAVLLAGLVLNALTGWSWADPVAGMVIAAVAVQEGRAAWRGDTCCAPVGLRAADESPESDDETADDRTAQDVTCACGDDCCR